ncbi:DUF1194 domain-containing protein [Falsiroseomonas sp.]|uniref:DUF1194 domain-containing protein n=1 Tax=Falsiroseomonas sp. TaxID=2870721 RepID=UPI002732E1CD|nr:DUF1194 domain-containing protein [Falsiroseomonas sp.]MDP3417871.1 DUF1194 domain-containing protein [Falsiroseomonas sp.]
MSRLRALSLVGALAVAAAPATACDIALVLALDVSGSVTTETYALQRDGTAAALESPAVARSAAHGLALSVVMWGSGQHNVLPWRVLTSAADAQAAAADLRRVQRPEAGMTNVAAALRAGIDEFRAQPCTPVRRIIDISGDGRHSGAVDEVAGAVADARAYGIEVNALPVVTDQEPGVADWYRQHVTGPAGGFTIPADWAGFSLAIRAKLAMEIAAR